MGVTVHKNSLENCNLLTKSGFSKKKVDYFDGNLLNKKMVVTKMLTKSRLLTILQLTKSGFHCIAYNWNDKLCQLPLTFTVHTTMRTCTCVE